MIQVSLQSEQVTLRTHQGFQSNQVRKLSKSIGAQVSCEEFKPSIDRKSCTHSNGTTFYNNLIKFKWGSHPRKPTTRGTLSGFKDPTNRRVLGMQP